MPTSKRYITICQQKILLEIAKRGKINFSMQNIYKNRLSFNKRLNQLYNAGWLNRKKIKLNGHFANEYTTTLEGSIIIKAVFVNFYESNN